MFTGIVQDRYPVISVRQTAGTFRIVVALPVVQRKGLKRGASVSVAGVCLTVAGIARGRVAFEVMGETLRKTTLGTLKSGNLVNVERSARIGDELGGHLVSGHVSGRARIASIVRKKNETVLRLHPETPSLLRYLFPKGFVALDGASLTVADVGRNFFTVHLIPETLRRTTFSLRRTGDVLNLEIDPLTRTIVDTVRRV